MKTDHRKASKLCQFFWYTEKLNTYWNSKYERADQEDIKNDVISDDEN